VSRSKKQFSWAKSLLLLFLGLTVALSAHLPLAAVAQDIVPSELRGIWLTNVDSDVLFSTANLRQGIDRLEKLKFNTIYPTVWNGGYTLYPSKVAKEVLGAELDPEPGLQGRDMLEEAIDMGHDKSLSVIPWFEFGLMAPAGSALAQRHPDWISKRKDGSQVFQQHNESMVWLNPAHPEVQQFMKDMMVEVVEKYDLDGVQLDDHFGMPVELGYDEYTVALYQQEHNGRKPPENPNNPAWKRWRASKVTDLMLGIYSAVKTRRPDAIVSLSPNPREFSYDMYLQDWANWARLGFVDELIVQIYRNDFSRFLYEVADLEKPEMVRIRSRVPVSIGILTGLRVMNVDMGQIQKQVQTARDRRFSGFSFFFYGSLGDRDTAFQAMLPSAVGRPLMETASRPGARPTTQAETRPEAQPVNESRRDAAQRERRDRRQRDI
jgi:uncharacterized lipoprotein YddW (UPF0748 family)